MGKKACDKLKKQLEPDPKSKINTYCTDSEGIDSYKYIEIPYFCGSMLTRDSNTICTQIGDSNITYIDGTTTKSNEWKNSSKDYNDNIKIGRNRYFEGIDHNIGYDNKKCTFNANIQVAGGTAGQKFGDANLTGCCRGCAILGSGKLCERNNYNADPIVCCINDYNSIHNTGQKDLCWQSSRRQRTCDPKYRDLGSNVCGNLLKKYCTGQKLLPNQKNWKQLWSKDTSLDFNYLLQEQLSNTDEDISKNVSQPCLQVLTRQLTGERGLGISSWEELKKFDLLITEANPDGLKWAEDVVNIIFDKYIKENLGNIIPSIDSPGYIENNNFLDVLYDICKTFPFLCKYNLQSICNNIKSTDIASNPNVLKWCGCYLSNDIYKEYINKFSISIPCTPYCNRDDVIPLTDKKNNRLLCTQSICIIDNVNIDITNSRTPGGLTFTQLCNGCGVRKSETNYDKSLDELDKLDISKNGIKENKEGLQDIFTLNYITIREFNTYWKELKKTKGNLYNSSENTNISLLKKWVDTKKNELYKLEKDNKTYYLVAGIPWDLFKYTNCDISTGIPKPNVGSFCEKEENKKNEINCNSYFGYFANNNTSDTTLYESGSGIFFYEPISRDLIYCKEFLYNIKGKFSCGIYNRNRNIKLVPFHLFVKNNKQLEEKYKIFLNYDLNNNNNEGSYEEDLKLIKLGCSDTVFLENFDDENTFSCCNNTSASNILHWDMGSVVTDNLLSFNPGFTLTEISRCDCKISGTLQIANSYLKELNLEENCNSEVCYNIQGQQIPCGGACYDQNNNPVECSTIGFGDFTYDEKITREQNENYVNSNSKYTLWLIIGIILILLVILIFV